MTTKPKRPPSVWISQIVIGLYLLLFSFSLLMLSLWANIPIVAVVWVIFIFSLFGGAFLGLTWRKTWGRWLTFGLFSLMFVGTLAAQFIDVSGPIPRETPSNSAQMIGYVIGAAIFFIPFGFLIYRLGFGEPANNFFNPPQESEGTLEPPPPPTFAE